MRPHERVKMIFKKLREGPISLTTLAEDLGMGYRTCMEYIDMIVDIQHRVKVEKIPSRRTTLVRLVQE